MSNDLPNDAPCNAKWTPSEVIDLSTQEEKDSDINLQNLSLEFQRQQLIPNNKKEFPHIDPSLIDERTFAFADAVRVIETYDIYHLCPCGCGKKWKFVRNDYAKHEATFISATPLKKD